MRIEKRFNTHHKSVWFRKKWLFILLLTIMSSLIFTSIKQDQAYFITHNASIYNPQDDQSWKSKAERMVREQVENRGVDDEKVLEAMRNTPRHRFVPGTYAQHAYADSPLPIGHDQTISQPYIVALMTELLDVQESDKILEIGTGSGYQAAILGKLAGEVYTIEIVEALAMRSKALLKEMNLDNIHVKHGDGYKGWPEEAPFDKIIVTAAPEEVPKALKEQLKPGGKMVLPVGDRSQLLKVIRKTAKGKISEETITGVRFVPMIHGE
ncbi:MAG: protein-L-isoaspartate(D-aspartate) O-methyltransferase [Bacteroidota bacterium]